MEYIVSIIVENKVGVLSEISFLFAHHGLNITSLTAAETEDEAYSRITIVTEGKVSVADKMMRELKELPEVVKIITYTHVERISRELALIKIDAQQTDKKSVERLVSSFQARIIESNKKHIIIEAVESEKGLDNLLHLLRPCGILETVRSGQITIGI